MPLLFVYGTLMRGERNHAHLRGARFVDAVATTPDYTLHRVVAFDYPALVAEGVTSVSGELYDVDEELLPALDAFEGRPYARAEITLGDGRRVEGYVVPASGLDGTVPIPDGRWTAKGERC
jgi:gamma-glutamylcyclotransferase (GGCT)/AIG2-like uncharacterized protein YtfP